MSLSLIRKPFLSRSMQRYKFERKTFLKWRLLQLFDFYRRIQEKLMD